MGPINRKRKSRSWLICILITISAINIFGGVNLTQKQIDSLAIEVVKTAKTQIGVRELTGNNDGNSVEAYLRSVGLKKGNPYCVAGLFWCFIQNGIKLNIPNPAYSPNWFSGTMKIVNRKSWMKTDFISKPADVMGFFMSGKGRIGHGELIEYENKKNYFTIGFNTSGTDTDNGDGVRPMIRNKNLAYAICRPLESKYILVKP